MKITSERVSLSIYFGVKQPRITLSDAAIAIKDKDAKKIQIIPSRQFP